MPALGSGTNIDYSSSAFDLDSANLPVAFEPLLCTLPTLLTCSARLPIAQRVSGSLYNTNQGPN